MVNFMELKVNNKKLEIHTLDTIFFFFLGLKFVLQPIKEGYRFKSKYANTYLLCQRVDIMMTDRNNTILHLYENVKTEKIILPKWKVTYTYFLPLHTSKHFQIGDTLNIKERKDS